MGSCRGFSSPWGSLIRRYALLGDVTFGGHAPEPLERNLAPLRHAMQAAGRRPELRTIGVATDGDGDRISAMDERGTFIDPHRTYALILRYLVEERGWRGPVVLSSSVSDLIRRMARTYELEIIETPIGFKYATEHLVRRDILMAGEESGGLAVRRYLPERDGVYSSLLLAELLAASEEASSDLVKSLHARFGPQVYRRADLEIESPLDAVNRVIVEQPGTFAGRAVREIETLDGVKLRFKDGWLLFRASGTEPILRTPLRDGIGEGVPSRLGGCGAPRTSVARNRTTSSLVHRVTVPALRPTEPRPAVVPLWSYTWPFGVRFLRTREGNQPWDTTTTSASSDSARPGWPCRSWDRTWASACLASSNALSAASA